MEFIKNNEQIILINDYKKLIIRLTENSDLYWQIIDNNSDNNMKIFEITKEDYQIYETFELLYNDMINQIMLSKFESRYSYNDRNQPFSWVSDNNESNIVTIFKEEDRYVLVFILRDYQSSNNIKFSHKLYNLGVMKHFKNLYNLKINHQIHIEEYLYLKQINKI